MATLAFSWQMIHDAAHEPFRRQVEMAMWRVARDLHLAGTVTGQQRELVVKVLRGDKFPAEVAITAAAADTDVQDAYVAGGNQFPDQAVLDWILAAWPVLAGVGS